MIQYEEEKEREEEETSDLIQLGNAFGPKVVGMINQNGMNLVRALCSIETTTWRFHPGGAV